MNRRSAEHASKNKEATATHKRVSSFKIKYGITISEYDLLFKEQEGACAICKTHQSTQPIALAVDHCHTTGKVRGLLCGKCNRGIGLFEDREDILVSAIHYLKERKDVN
jgi:hypothetical protein